MSARLRLVVVSVALLIGVALVTPTEAQSRFWVLVNGALNYNGPVRVGNGSPSAPAFAFTSEPNMGRYRIGATAIGEAVGGTGVYALTGSDVRLVSTMAFGWSANTSLGASDTTITRVAAGQFGYTAVLFANLGTPANGTFCYCSDCTIANPCASGGTGAWAKRLNGVWVCN